LVRYEEIARQLEVELEVGGAAARTIASEHELCRRYGVSRTTIRAALKRLAAQGLIERQQGKGTFYRPPHIAKHLGSIVDFHTEAIEAGRVPSTKVVSLVMRPATAGEIALFGSGISHGGIAELIRVRSLDARPAVLQRSYLGRRILGRANAADLENRSLYRYLAERRGITIATIEETLEPCRANASEAARLGIANGTAVFRSHRVARDGGAQVIEVSDNLIRGDIYRFKVHRRIGDGDHH